MRQYADLRDLESFAQLGDEFSKKDYEQRLASVRESMRTVEGIFAPPHEMHTHWAVIILVGIRLEENIRAVAASLHSRDHLQKSIKNFEGNLIDKFRSFLTESAGWKNNQLPEDSLWEDILGVYAIRNCLVHSHANFGSYAAESALRAKQIQGFAARHATPGFVDTWLDIDLQSSLACIRSVQAFFDALFVTLRHRSDYLNTDHPDDEKG